MQKRGRQGVVGPWEEQEAERDPPQTLALGKGSPPGFETCKIRVWAGPTTSV